MTAFDDELDALDECLDVLADCRLTFLRMRPTGDIDAATLERVEVAGNTAVTVDAIRDDDRHNGGNGLQTNQRAWVIHAADLPWTPTRTTRCTDDDGLAYQIIRAERQRDGRDWGLIGQRID